MNTQNVSATATITEKAFRNGVMPRAQLSKLACEIAIEKTNQADVKQFARWELMEATTVINVLEDLGTTVPSISYDAKTFLSKLKSLSGKEFDKEYMAVELSNHEFLRGLAQNYIDGVDEKVLGNEKETFHVAQLALFAFTEHVGLCKRISSEISAN
jgi:predicted outer membrane protein